MPSTCPTPRELNAHPDSGHSIDCQTQPGPDFGTSSLHLASSKGHLFAVHVLLSLGSDINAQDEHGRTALHYAAKLGYEDIVCCLLVNGATVDLTDCSGLRGLHMAAQNGHNSVLRNLVYYGADVNAQVVRV